jgi:hypothetical protein
MVFCGAQPLTMKNKKWLRFVESFVVLPTLMMSAVPVGSISQAVLNIVNTPTILSIQKQNMVASGHLAINSAEDQKLQAQKIKADSIDAYFKKYDMPLAGQGMKMVIEAEKNNIDWRLLPAIAVRESTGGKHACKKATFSYFGWGSCKINFSSHEEAIETVAHNLGGNNPKTSHHYDEKTTLQILRAYNPPSIVPRYAEQVMAIMDAIGPADTEPEILAST